MKETWELDYCNFCYPNMICQEKGKGKHIVLFRSDGSRRMEYDAEQPISKCPIREKTICKLTRTIYEGKSR